MRGAVVGCKSIQRVYCFLYVLVRSRSYYYVRKNDTIFFKTIYVLALTNRL